VLLNTDDRTVRTPAGELLPQQLPLLLHSQRRGRAVHGREVALAVPHPARHDLTSPLRVHCHLWRVLRASEAMRHVWQHAYEPIAQRPGSQRLPSCCPGVGLSCRGAIPRVVSMLSAGVAHALCTPALRIWAVCSPVSVRLHHEPPRTPSAPHAIQPWCTLNHVQSSVKLQGWPKRCKLAQYVDCESLPRGREA
jgi:hypothetical protein